MNGIIFDIKHFAIHDGPGVRQTIFFKGCPLSCQWCHNPESRSRDIFSYEKEEIIDGRKVCEIQTIGKNYTLNELMTEIQKDIVFFEESGGGITLSGGEPLLQFDFVMNLLRECRKMEIHTCVDTTGDVSTEKIKKIAPFTNLFLYDLKHMDDRLHKKYTGVSNTGILNNLKTLDEFGKDIWIRFPLIPGINDDESNLFRMMEFLLKLNNRYPISILPYHSIGSHKYEQFGIEYCMNKINEPNEEYIVNIKNIFKEAGFNVVIGG